MTSEAPGGFHLNDDLRSRIFSEYVESLCQACLVLGMPFQFVEYNERELRLAIAEANIDISATLSRRSQLEGISMGRVAGIVAFRLSRFKIVHFKEDGWSNPRMHLTQELAAIFLVCRIFIKQRLPEICVMELAYQFSRRHANQETAGLFFDAFTLPAS